MKPTALPLLVACVASPALAHHGVAGVGAAALEGPGAPVESASSAVLPEGRTLFYAKLDDARFKLKQTVVLARRKFRQMFILKNA